MFDLTFTSNIPRFPKPRLPALSAFPDIAGDTVAITFVSYAVSVSLAMIYADKHGYSIHPNQVENQNIALSDSPQLAACLCETCF